MLLSKARSSDIVRAGLGYRAHYLAQGDADFKVGLSLHGAETAGLSKHSRFHLGVLRQPFTGWRSESKVKLWPQKMSTVLTDAPVRIVGCCLDMTANSSQN